MTLSPRKALSAVTRRARPVVGTLRFRLTLLYGGLFVVAGAALLSITYALVYHASSNDATEIAVQHVSGAGGGASVAIGQVGGGLPLPPPATVQGQGQSGTITSGGGQPLTNPLPSDIQQKVDYAKQVATAQRSDLLHRLLEESGIALLIVAVIAIGAGYWLARRSLSPLRNMAAKARKISEANLHERLAVGGPLDELKELGDTFDGMLARLEGAFAAQRRFVANAGHELRTPMTYQRTLLEVTLADPKADAATLREACERTLRAGEEQERLVEALLTLARSQRGLGRSEPVDVAAAAVGAVAAIREAGTGPNAKTQPEVRISLQPNQATAKGEPSLVRRLVTNLVENAVRHNEPIGGWVQVSTETAAGKPRLRVVNSGTIVPPDKLDSLFQPFQRLEGRASRKSGLGLGLSIVAAIADAHGARLSATARAEGGLDITVEFPAVEASDLREFAPEPVPAASRPKVSGAVAL